MQQSKKTKIACQREHVVAHSMFFHGISLSQSTSRGAALKGQASCAVSIDGMALVSSTTDTESAGGVCMIFCGLGLNGIMIDKRSE